MSKVNTDSVFERRNKI